MKVHLVAFGKLKTPGLRLTADYYSRNLRPWVEFEETELKALSAPDKSPATRLKIQKKEAEILESCLESRLQKRDALVLLDETGKNLTTREWAEMLKIFKDEGQSVAFCIGSHFGFEEQFRKKAHRVLSLGRQTLPHELARVVLLEQIYRGFSVIAGHPYHNEG